MRSSRRAIIEALRDAGSETQLTRALAAAFAADRRLAASFVNVVLRASKRGSDPRWSDLPEQLDCSSEVPLTPADRVDLEFRDAETGWRILVELKITAGYGFEQIARYLAALDPRDGRQVLVSVTRDRPKYGDPSLDGRPHWAGSLSWASIYSDLLALEASDPALTTQWRALLEVLDDEGSMGVTRVEPELLEAWSRAAPARQHAVAFMESLRMPLFVALEDVLATTRPSHAAPRAAVAGSPTAGRRPQVDVNFEVPAGGPIRLAAQLWAWEDFRYVISTRFPSTSGQAAAEVTHTLASAGFANWKDSWLWRSLPLNADLLRSESLEDELLHWSRETFQIVASSGVLALPVDPVSVADEDDFAI